ncbi:hypothetical protein EZ449_20325 [Pedobacter frigidisoli]|uniref:Uncharacterized protein n=1 Tax=Pedobacter frigidisoli TaxID=2530455 RepID=A0A4R0NJ96_9SPHI|nr:hypothetical protein [Pedobacter frigidisoli]TCD00596.1 hypothetical protein EZ449_20325 [Pedobacter frigidisoli]
MKTKIISLSFCLLFLLIFSSCRTYLTPAILGNNMGYLPKAMGADSVKSITNFSASFAGANSPDTKVTFELGMANISQARTFKQFNIAYGVFGYAGKASNGIRDRSNDDTDDYLPSFNKSISGFSLRFSTGLHNTSSNGNTDFRYINFENAISFESGAYGNFRKEIYNGRVPNYVAVTDRKIIWSTGLSTEVIWRARRNHDIRNAFRFFIGGTPGLASSFKYGGNVSDYENDQNSAGFVVSYYLYIKKFTMTLETANSVNLANKITLGYSL